MSHGSDRRQARMKEEKAKNQNNDNTTVVVSEVASF